MVPVSRFATSEATLVTNCVEELAVASVVESHVKKELSPSLAKPTVLPPMLRTRFTRKKLRLKNFLEV